MNLVWFSIRTKDDINGWLRFMSTGTILEIRRTLVTDDGILSSPPSEKMMKKELNINLFKYSFRSNSYCMILYDSYHLMLHFINLINSKVTTTKNDG